MPARKTTAVITKATNTIRMFPSYANAAFVAPISEAPRELFHIARVTVR
jgi:hypothetical protein